ncbi:hypothetical protein Avbf_08545 [Armadillidium vulgare]|nr:hypothetical protein Avbf_08545 [Armadillidium vulgare]
MGESALVLWCIEARTIDTPLALGFTLINTGEDFKASGTNQNPILVLV